MLIEKMARYFLSLVILLFCSWSHAQQIDTQTPTDQETTEPVQESTSPAPQSDHPNLDSFFVLYQPYINNISAHEPIYFLAGTNPKKSKFQLSLKYRFLNDRGTLAQNHPWVKGFHIAYTQTSFWDLKSDSLPFEDTSYKPEFFHLTSNISLRPSWMQGLFLQSGYLHESNGKSEEFSRSTNLFYLNPVMIFYDRHSKYGLALSPKVYAPYDNSKSGNPDLYDYRGYFELRCIVGKADSFVLNSSLRWAKKGGSVQLDLTYPTGKYLSDNFDIYLQAQYVSTLAENLLHYKDRTEAVRLGLALVR